MNNENYCSHEQAVKLKEKGFEWPQGKPHYIDKILGSEREEWDDEQCQWCTITDIVCYPKVPLHIIQKWLRDEEEILVLPIRYIHYSPTALYWGVEEHRGLDIKTYAEYETYEQALSAGITKALELI